MNIMSTLGEEKNVGDNFDEEDEQLEPEASTAGLSEGYCDDESPVIVRMRERKSLSRPQSDETSRVRSPSTQSLVLRGRDARGAPRWMLERSRSAFIKPWWVVTGVLSELKESQNMINGNYASLDISDLKESF